MMGMLCLLTLSSCNEEMIQDSRHGYLGISLDNDLSEDLVTKAGEEDLVFSVNVLNMSGAIVKSVTDHRQITLETPIVLNVGSYKAEAFSGEKLNAAFENPYYEGKTARSFKISPEQTTSVEITCTLANTIFSVEFPESFSADFSDYEVAVTNGKGDKLVFSNNPQAGNALEAGFDKKAYLDVTGTLTWELYLKNIDGSVHRATGTYTDVKAKQHYHLAFSLEEDKPVDGGFIINVNLQNSWDDSEHNFVLDFSKKDMPEITSNPEFAVESGVSYSVLVNDASQKTLNFTAPEGIRSMHVSHQNEVLSMNGVPETIELVDASVELISTLNAAGFKASSVTAGALATSIDMTELFKELPAGIYDMKFSVIDTKGRYKLMNLILEILSDVDCEAVSAKAGWATFARLEARILNVSKKDQLTFQYKKAADTEWIEMTPSEMDVNMSTLRYSTVLCGLEPDTQYEIRAVSDGKKDTKVLTFTTEGTPVLHNMNFDSWTDGDKFPNASGFKVWDSANSSGAATTTSPTDDAVSGKAAKLESKKALGLLAAGNIFTGSFGEVAFGPAGAGAKLNWGSPFTGRPLALRGYYKYTPTVINDAKDPYSSMKGQMDQCQIVVALADVSGPYALNTATSTFIDFDNDPGILAYGQFNSGESSSTYREVIIPLVYRDLTRVPTYAIVAAASSRYGDYFTGGLGSVMYIDEFEFVYDPQELTDEQYAKVFSRVEPF